MRMYMIITYFPLKLEMQRRLEPQRNFIDRKVPKYHQKTHKTFHFISLYSIQWNI